VRGGGARPRRGVVPLDKLTYAGSLESLAPVARDPLHRFVRADIGDAGTMRALFHEARPAAVIHLAAESHVDRSIDAPAPFIHTNVVGTATLLDAATHYWRGLPDEEAAAFRFVHVSTDEVFGELGDEGRFDEETPYRPNSPYAASTAAADHLARAWHRTYGLPTLVTNCSNNYGPYQYPEKLIPVVVRHAAARQPIPVYGRGANVRDWLHVEDHVEGLVRALDAGTPGGTYLFGGGTELTNLQLVHAICDHVDALLGDGGAPRRELVKFVADRPGHDHRYAIDASGVAHTLDWEPRVPFAEGLRGAVAWYLAHPAWHAQESTAAAWLRAAEGATTGATTGATAGAR
jgi:dTDP-glucose 4,6-dehydratase